MRLAVAHQLIRQHNLQNEKTLALVVDDTIKHRRGRKVAATSSHFDHTLDKKVMGQQVLEAGLATQKGYAPLDSEIYVSKKKVLDAKVSFKDKCSAVARDYEVAKKDNKKINGLSFSRHGNRLFFLYQFLKQNETAAVIKKVDLITCVDLQGKISTSLDYSYVFEKHSQ